MRGQSVEATLRGRTITISYIYSTPAVRIRSSGGAPLHVCGLVITSYFSRPPPAPYSFLPPPPTSSRKERSALVQFKITPGCSTAATWSAPWVCFSQTERQPKCLSLIGYQLKGQLFPLVFLSFYGGCVKPDHLKIDTIQIQKIRQTATPLPLCSRRASFNLR